MTTPKPLSDLLLSLKPGESLTFRRLTTASDGTECAAAIEIYGEVDRPGEVHQIARRISRETLDASRFDHPGMVIEQMRAELHLRAYPRESEVTLARRVVDDLICRSLRNDDIATIGRERTPAVTIELERRANVFVRKRTSSTIYCGTADDGTWVVEVVT
jgi:hypothetical protein